MKGKKNSKQELHQIIVEFGLAMERANYSFIADSGKMTYGMQDIWMRYQEWCHQNRHL